MSAGDSLFEDRGEDVVVCPVCGGIMDYKCIVFDADGNKRQYGYKCRTCGWKSGDGMMKNYYDEENREYALSVSESELDLLISMSEKMVYDLKKAKKPKGEE